MHCRVRESGSALVCAIALAGCGDYRFQGGLVNVPHINRAWTAEDFSHDVIANGDESCEGWSGREDDPVPGRWPPCLYEDDVLYGLGPNGGHAATVDDD